MKILSLMALFLGVVFMALFSLADSGRETVDEGDFQKRRLRGRHHTPVAPNLKIGQITSAGPGCPQGTYAHSVSPDGSALSILFDRFQVEVENSKRQRRQRTSCRLMIPLNVESGYQVSVAKIDMRGYLYLPNLGQARISNKYYFSKGENIRNRRRIVRRKLKFQGPVDEDFVVSAEMQRPSWSPCSKSITLNVESRLSVRLHKQSPEGGIGVVDSLDGDIGGGGATNYFLTWRKCRQKRKASRI